MNFISTKKLFCAALFFMLLAGCFFFSSASVAEKKSASGAASPASKSKSNIPTLQIESPFEKLIKESAIDEPEIPQMKTGSLIPNATASTKQAEKKVKMLNSLPAALPGKFEYYEGDSPRFHVVDISAVMLDDAPAIIVLTSAAIEVYRFYPNSRLKRVWAGKFSSVIPSRGLAGRIISGKRNGEILIYVSMNKFANSFGYRWKSNSLEIVGKVKNYFVDTLPSQSLNMMSEYGKGINSFNGTTTGLVLTGGEAPDRRAFPLPQNYYSACIVNWNSSDTSKTRVALVTEDGTIQVYDGLAKLRAASAEKFGAGLVCGKTASGAGAMITSSSSDKDDGIVMLDISGDKVSDRWRSNTLPGAIAAFSASDFDGDGKKEIFGALAKSSGGIQIFRILPGN